MLDSKHLDVEKSSYINVCEWDMLYEVLWVLRVEKKNQLIYHKWTGKHKSRDS